jgi:hypothetical protein
MNYFKGDELELKMYNAGLPALQAISLGLEEAFLGIYECVPMGELLWDEQRVPLTNAIKREIFIQCFKQVFEAWTFCGTFESYLLVFRKIFGDDASIEFTVPGPGKLQIDIETFGAAINPIVVREISGGSYTIYNLVDEVGDNICAQTTLGIETQYELEKILFSMVPNGIYTEISLTIGA